MFSKIKTTKSTKAYSDNLKKIKKLIAKYDNIVIGAGAGLSTSAGLFYGGERFQKNFPDFIEKYGLTDMYSSAFYDFKTPEEKWAYFSRHIMLNRYTELESNTYKNLLSLIEHKNYFVLTTNADKLFHRNNFNDDRIFFTQGDYGVFQCSTPCSNEIFDNRDMVFSMVTNQKDMKIPSELIPLCPKCQKPLAMNLRIDNTFVEDENWNKQCNKYYNFINTHKDILFIELGVGLNTPGIIKYPFWQMTHQNDSAFYISINLDEDYIPAEISEKSIVIKGDISDTLSDLVALN